MTLIIKHNTYKEIVFRILLLLTAIFSTSMLQSCSENDIVSDDKAVVVLSCKSTYSGSSAKQDSSVTRAISSSTEGYVQDLTVYIFNSSGDVIGSNYSSYTTASNTTINMSIITRPATGCTIYVVANAGSGTFSGVYNKTLFDQKYASITGAANLQSDNTYPIMFGKVTGETITAGTNSLGTINVARLLSKITFNLVPKNKDTNYPITIDSYQLNHVPLNCYYVDTYTASTSTLSSYGDFDAVSPTTGNVDGNTLSFTYYVYENLAGTNSASTTWKLRNKTNRQPNASYLTVKAHTAIWKSKFYIYLGGKNLTTSDASPTYDYTDYNIYRNTNYTVTVNIYGSGSSEDDLRVDYDANIYFSTPGIAAWTSNSVDVTM